MSNIWLPNQTYSLASNNSIFPLGILSGAPYYYITSIQLTVDTNYVVNNPGVQFSFQDNATAGYVWIAGNVYSPGTDTPSPYNVKGPYFETAANFIYKSKTSGSGLVMTSNIGSASPYIGFVLYIQYGFASI